MKKYLIPKDGEVLKEAKFPIDQDDVYIRITVKDSSGKYANTNAYFVEDFEI